MAHIGDKGALDTAGALRLFLKLLSVFESPPKFFLHSNPIGNIRNNPHDAPHISRGIGKGGFIEEHSSLFSSPANHPLVTLVPRGCQELLISSPVLLRNFPRPHVKGGFAENFFFRKSRIFPEGLVASQITPMGILVKDGVRNGFEKAPHKIELGIQFFLHLFTAGHGPYEKKETPELKYRSEREDKKNPTISLLHQLFRKDFVGLIGNHGKQHGISPDGDGIGIHPHVSFRSVVETMAKIEGVEAPFPGQFHLPGHFLGRKEIDMFDVSSDKIRISVKSVGCGVCIQNKACFGIDEKHGETVFCKKLVSKKALRGYALPLFHQASGIIEEEKGSRR